MKKLLAVLLLFGATFANAQKNTKSPQENSSKPFNIGTIEEIQSTVLGEKRILNVYLPEGYNKNDTTRYPVIYLLDGSADEDFIHVVGLVQFSTFPWINKIPKCIVVGIANVDRKRDFTFASGSEDYKKVIPNGGKSAAFISFIEKELQPYISKNFKTNGRKALIGQSLGGLLTTEILLKHSALFDTYVIISPSIWWNNASLLKEESVILTENFNQKLNIYIGVGKEGVTPTTSNPRVMEVDANLLAEKLKNSKNKNLKVYFDYLPDKNHATAGYQALYNAVENNCLSFQ